MMYFLVEEHRTCYHLLASDAFDVLGVNKYLRMFSGNFWWARASYLAGCPRPILTSERYYYESWLGLRENGEAGSVGDTVSACVDGPKTPLGVVVESNMSQCKKIEQ